MVDVKARVRGDSLGHNCQHPCCDHHSQLGARLDAVGPALPAHLGWTPSQSGMLPQTRAYSILLLMPCALSGNFRLQAPLSSLLVSFPVPGATSAPTLQT